MKTPESAHPPFALRFLSWFCPAHLYEEIEGDLIQKFNRDVNVIGEKRAKRKLLWDVIRFFRPGIILRNKLSFHRNQIDMIKSYFTILFRSLLKRKFYSVINISCLTVGITFALLIGMFIHGELQVNKHLADADRLYLLESKAQSRDYREFFSSSHLVSQCVTQYPNLFESYYRFLDRNITVSKGDKHFRIQSMIGDASLLTMFGFPVIAGNAASALKDPNSIVVTRKVANQFFDNTNVVGQTLTVSTEQNGKKEYLITAVIENPDDKNSVSDFMDMNAQIFLTLENSKDFFPLFDQNSWGSFIISYIKLMPNIKVSEAEAAINRTIKGVAPKANDEPRTYFLNPLADYYRMTNHGAVQKLIWSLAVIVSLILLLAISNFIKIAIASSFSRAKEVGVRKVIGGQQWQVVNQFLLEACVISVIAGVLSVLFYELLHSYFADLLGAKLPSILMFDKSVWLLMLVGFLGIGFFAGVYPAIFQSMARPVDSLKGKFKSVQGTIQFSRGLIGTQFLITIFILIVAVVVSGQVSFFLEKDLGYDKARVLVVGSVPRLWNDAGFSKMEFAKKEFLQSKEIKAVSLSWGAPGNNFSPGGSKVHKAGTPSEKAIDHVITCGDEDYEKVYDLKLEAGSFLDEAGLQPRNSVVINKSAQKALGVQIGDQLKAIDYGDTLFTVRGIVSDFNYESLHEKIGPLMIMQPNDFRAYRYFNFKLATGNISELIKAVENAWKKAFPDDPFDYWFADERMKTMYTTELQMKKAANTASILMLIIVITGVLGLVSLSVSKRKKEIGIRKVLGASLHDILLLIAKEYALLIAISFVVAVPLAYLSSIQWLGAFAYRLELSWWMFALPGALLLIFTIVIVTVQAHGVAASNPVKSLKYE
jgi:putative ABC transport system permease protein